MGKGFGTSSIIMAALGAIMFYPFNIFLAGAAIFFAVLAALAGDIARSTTAAVLVACGLFLLSPIVMATIATQGAQGNHDVLLIVIASVSAPFVAMLLNVGLRSVFSQKNG